CLSRGQRFSGGLGPSDEEWRIRTRRQGANRADPAAGHDERLLPAGLDRRGDEADLEAAEPLESAQALLHLLERLDPVAEARCFLVAEVLGQARESRLELRERAGGERPGGERGLPAARDRPERGRLRGDDEVLAPRP